MALIAAAPMLLAFIEQIARTTMDGEPVNDGNGIYNDFVMENDDAVSTLSELIDEARVLEAETNARSPDEPEDQNIVIVEVQGGIAEVTKCPPAVTVTIIDHDSAKNGGAA
jgi:hypothetical protein